MKVPTWTHAPSTQAQPKHAEPKHAEPKHAPPCHPQPKPAQPWYAQPKHARPWHPQPKPAEPKHAQPWHAQPKPAQPRPAQPWKSGASAPRKARRASPGFSPVVVAPAIGEIRPEQHLQHGNPSPCRDIPPEKGDLCARLNKSHPFPVFHMWKIGSEPGIKPVIARDTTYSVSLLTGTICGSNFAIPRHEIPAHGNGSERLQ